MSDGLSSDVGLIPAGAHSSQSHPEGWECRCSTSSLSSFLPPSLTLTPEASAEGETINRKLITLVIWLAVVLSATIFTLRGPLRAPGDYANDFAAPYVSARLWL